MTLCDAGEELLLQGAEENYVIKVGTTMVLPNGSSLSIPVDFIGKTIVVLRMYLATENSCGYRERLSEDELNKLSFFCNGIQLKDSYVLQENDNITVKVTESHCDESAASQHKSQFDANNLQIEDYKAACLSSMEGDSLPIPICLIGKTIEELNSHLRKKNGKSLVPLSSNDLLRLKIYHQLGGEDGEQIDKSSRIQEGMQLFMILEQADNHLANQPQQADNHLANQPLEDCRDLQFDSSVEFYDNCLYVKIDDLVAELRIPNNACITLVDLMYSLEFNDEKLFELVGSPGDRLCKESKELIKSFEGPFVVNGSTYNSSAQKERISQGESLIELCKREVYLTLVLTLSDSSVVDPGPEQFLADLTIRDKGVESVAAIDRRVNWCLLVSAVVLVVCVNIYELLSHHTITCPPINRDGDINIPDDNSVWGGVFYKYNNTEANSTGTFFSGAQANIDSFDESTQNIATLKELKCIYEHANGSIIVPAKADAVKDISVSLESRAWVKSHNLIFCEGAREECTVSLSRSAFAPAYKN